MAVVYNPKAEPSLHRGAHIPNDVLTRLKKHRLGKPFHLVSAGYAESWQGHYTKRDALGEHIVIYCAAGKGFLETAHGTWDITPGMFLVCFAGKPHTYGADTATPWTIYWSHFSGTVSDEFITLAGLDERMPVITVSDHGAVTARFSEMLSLFTGDVSIAHTLHAGTMLSSIFTALACGRTPSAAFDMGSIVTYMQRRIRGNITLDECASLSGMSKYHFVRLFRKHTGYAPVDYFIRMKVQHSCVLLADVRKKIIDVARETGYDDQYYFSRVFTRIMGVSPRAYRKRLS
ncbi:MAG: AraC family transcriptional regulator [Spirochaetes bacterium]|nr:AraC family transcriptional regulator [Spirochaetota bacterium]